METTAQAATESDLLQRIAADNDARALSELIVRYQDFVYNTCLRILRNPSDAEDVAQECFMSFVRKATTVQSIGGWLHRCATQLSLNAVRSNTARRAREESYGTSNDRHADGPQWADLEPSIDEAVNALPDPTRPIVIRYFLQHKKEKEIAEEFGISIATISRRIDEGIQSIRSHLEKAGLMTGAGALSVMLLQAQAVPAPAALVASLGKIPLYGIVKGAAAASAGIGLKVAAVAACAAVLAGTAAVVVQKKTAATGIRVSTSSAMRISQGTLLGAPGFMPSPDRPVGWRGDGTGRFPGATPPLNWHRRPKDLSAFAVSARKPKGAVPAKSERVLAMPIREWLVLSQFETPDYKKGMAETQILETAIEPDLGMKTNGREWKTMPMDGHRAEIWKTVQVNKQYENGMRDWDCKDYRIIYAHTYVYSEKECEVYWRIDPGWNAAGVKMWINGEMVNDSTVIGMWNEVKTKNKFKAGWNRVLLKLWGFRLDWSFPAWFEMKPRNENEYDEKNIAWSSLTTGGGVAAPPIVVGDKVFLASDPHYLTCRNAADGKVLWIRSNGFFDAEIGNLRKAKTADASALEKVTAAMKAVEGINERIAAALGAKLPIDKEIQERQAQDTILAKLLETVDPERFQKVQRAWQQNEPGFSTAPCSDGKRVYVFFQNAVAAAYDLDGKRVWIRSFPHAGEQHHGFASSPVLAGGKLVIKQFTEWGLDAATGEIAWQHSAGHGHGSLVAARAGKIPLLVNGAFYRTDTGASWGPTGTLTFGIMMCSATLIDEHTAFGIKGGKYVIADLDGGAGPKQAKVLPTQNLGEIPTPVAYDGLIYMSDQKGVFSAIDMEGNIVYRKQLDANVRQNAHGGPGLCASPLLFGKNLYVLDDYGTVFIIEPGRTFKQIARNELQDLHSFWADPVGNHKTMCTMYAAGNRIFIRSPGTLWCIAETSPRP